MNWKRAYKSIGGSQFRKGYASGDWFIYKSDLCNRWYLRNLVQHKFWELESYYNAKYAAEKLEEKMKLEFIEGL